MNLAAWNVRTLLDRTDRPERRTAIIARMLNRYSVDIAALSETRFSGESCLEEVGGGYTFFWIGKPEGEPRTGGVGFAIRTSIVRDLDRLPRGISDRLMMIRLKLSETSYVTIISAYAPTMTYPDADKEAFYEELDRLILEVPHKDKLIVLGDFNARVGRDNDPWKHTLGCHGIGKINSNGLLLLSKCHQHNLAITNTMFQLPNKLKATWMHPRSKEWHLIDYVIVRQRDIKDVKVTRVMRGADCWSDHRMVRCQLSLNITPKRHRQRTTLPKKLNVSSLNDPAIVAELQGKLGSVPSFVNSEKEVEEMWKEFKSATYDAAAETLGFVKRKHQDWFDENDATIAALLNDMHTAHRAYISSKASQSLRRKYHLAKHIAQSRLRQMKNVWWEKKAMELQEAADNHNSKLFHEGLRAVYGPKSGGSAPIRTADGSKLLTEKSEILGRWAEHFNSLLNCPSTMSQDAIDDIPQRPIIEDLDLPPTLDEVGKAVKQASSGKAPGADGIPAEIFKHGGSHMLHKLHSLFTHIWANKCVPQDMKDASIVHLYKRKGDKTCCDNHRGISLLSIAGKILARVILNRMILHLVGSVYPESQCGFRSGRGTVDMIFSARQVQEKCVEQNKDLYAVFIDLTKAFDTVNRDGLWKLLRKFGCPETFTILIRSFHDGMTARVQESGVLSEPFPVTNGTKQGCVLAPTLFAIVFSALLLEAFRDMDKGVYLQFRTDGGLFNLRRLKARTKVMEMLIRDLLFADDCALVAHTLEDIQSMMDCFAAAARRFGLTISIKKTESMYQPAPGKSYVDPLVTIEGTTLKPVKKFCYLGSILSNSATIDDEVIQRIAKANSSYGRLRHRLWSDHGIRLSTKIQVYRAVVLPSLLYACETWTVYKRHLKQLEQFHLRCLRSICNIKWQDKIPNSAVLQLCHIQGTESMIMSAQLRWAGHLIRMSDERIPKAVLYGQLSHGDRSTGRPRLRYKDTLKQNLSSCGIEQWEVRAQDRDLWRHSCRSGVSSFEAKRIIGLEDKRPRRKRMVQDQPGDGPCFPCPVCGRV